MPKLKTDVVLIEKNGRTFSKRTEFYENGQIARMGIYASGQAGWSWNIPTGVVKSYYENGTPKSEISYNDYGSLEGESLYYDDKGRLSRKLTYSKDILLKEEFFETPVHAER